MGFILRGKGAIRSFEPVAQQTLSDLYFRKITAHILARGWRWEKTVGKQIRELFSGPGEGQ